MKKIAIYIGVALLLLAIIAFQQNRIGHLKNERNRHRDNAKTLLMDVEQYRTSDSLNAAQVGILELKIKEFEQFRAADAELIKTLKTKNRDLQAVTTFQNQTIIDLRANVRDSIVYVDKVVRDTLYYICMSDKWYFFEGTINRKGEFNGMFENRDSLLIAETVKFKRFLFWKTKKVKDRRIDVVSKNPHTNILGFEVVTIEK